MLQRDLYRSHIAEKVTNCFNGIDAAIVCVGLHADHRSTVLGSRAPAMPPKGAKSDRSAGGPRPESPRAPVTVADLVLTTIFETFKTIPDEWARTGALSVNLAAASTLEETTVILGKPVSARTKSSARRALSELTATAAGTASEDATIMYMITVCLTGSWGCA